MFPYHSPTFAIHIGELTLSAHIYEKSLGRTTIRYNSDLVNGLSVIMDGGTNFFAD